MERFPLRQVESTHPAAPAGRARVPFSRLQRLQVVLLLALGFWFIDSGMSSDSGLESGRSGKTEGVAAGPIPRAPALGGERSFDAATLERLLGGVNPNLAPRELSRISAAVLRYSGKYELDPELVTAVLLVESSARPWARSPRGAVGLMQVMPHMMEPLGLAGNAATIESNIEAGCWILAGNIRRLGEEQGISSYFWGSEIRGPGYLEKVQATRAEVRRYLRS
jgi:soluble lytic murein transglycosylase-like protein